MFERFSGWVADATGKPLTFALSVILVVVWAITGPMFDYNDTWQLIINTATTVITFWMVFVLQNTQNKDTKAMELKLDELVRAVAGTDKRLIGIEDDTERPSNGSGRRRTATRSRVARPTPRPRSRSPGPGATRGQRETARRSDMGSTCWRSRPATDRNARAV